MNEAAGSASLNRWGEFRDRELEQAFFSGYIEGSRRAILLIELLVSAALLLMTVLELSMAGAAYTRWGALGIRAVIFVPQVLLCCFLRRGLSNGAAARWLALNVFILIAGYQILLLVSHDLAFSDQAISFIVVVVAVFMLPIRWIYALCLWISTAASFFICCAVFFEMPPQALYYRHMIYFGAAIGFAAIFSYRLSTYRRTQYANSIRLEHISVTDRLTSIYNRQFFDGSFERLIRAAEGQGAVFSLIMTDIDNFKRINDAHGHAAGDEALVAVAHAVRDGLRTEDIFSRWGGEEFMILLPNLGLDRAEHVAGRLRAVVEERFSATYGITASFGVTEYRPGDTPDTMTRRVDKLMYEAKRAGKNQVVTR